jgi:hypothetical protein
MTRSSDRRRSFPRDDAFAARFADPDLESGRQPSRLFELCSTFLRRGVIPSHHQVVLASGADIQISCPEKLIRCQGVEVLVGKEISVTCDGFVVADAVETAPPKLITNPYVQEVLRWADDVRRGRIAVYTTAKTASEVQFAIDVEELADEAKIWRFWRIFFDELPRFQEIWWLYSIAIY